VLCLPSSSQACYSLSDVSKKLKELVEGALQSLWVASAFIDRCGVELLKRVCARGVQVRVLTSTEIDEDVLRELAEVAEVRVVKEKFMHMKLYIADGKALTGSANLTCPVLEGKNIEILCEIPIEEAVKSFNTLWESAEGPEFLQEELWLRVKDTQQRVVIESKIMSGLHVEIDKMLKRPVVKRDKGVEVCPDSVEEVCIECAEPTSFWYESIARGAIEYLRAYPVNLCYWRSYIIAAENLASYDLYGKTTIVSPATFIVLGLYPVARSLCGVKLGQELATGFIEELSKLGADIVNRCKASSYCGIQVCLRFLPRVEVNVVYNIKMTFTAYQTPECSHISQDTLKMLESFVEQSFNNIKLLFEEKVRRLYEEYQKKLQSYGAKRIEIDGPLIAKLRVNVVGIIKEYKVELGQP